jgi:pimeloyl-ACP methyl ester carboxylesterase
MAQPSKTCRFFSHDDSIGLDCLLNFLYERIVAVRAPTLIFHAKDDTLQLHRNAEFAASTIPGARLVSFERGGHLLIAIEQTTIREDT